MGDDAEADKKRFDKVKLTKEQSMTSGVSFHACDTIITSGGARVIIFGGQRTGLSADMWVYEPTGDGWTQCFKATEATPWPAPRTQATFTAIGAEPQARMVLIGGYVLNIAEQNDVWAVDLTVDMAEVTTEWVSCTCSGSPPEKRYGHSASLVGQHMAVFGGQGKNFQYNNLFMLNVGGSDYAWSEPAVSGVPPSVRSAHLALALPAGGKVLVHGGFNRADRCLDDAYTLTVSDDGASAEWAPTGFNTQGKQPPRAQHAGAMLPGSNYGYIFGGYDGTKNLQDLLLFSMDAKGGPVIRDVACGPAPEPRCRHSAHAIGNSFVIIGGYNGTLPYPADVYTLDTEDVSATLAKLMQAPASPMRRGSTQRRSSTASAEKKEGEEKPAEATGTE